MTGIDPVHVQVLAAFLFCAGLATVLVRRNLFFMLMGLELMLNAAILSFVGFSRTLEGSASLHGQIVPLFTMAIAAAAVCVGLALVMLMFRARESLDSDACATSGD